MPSVEAIRVAALVSSRGFDVTPEDVDEFIATGYLAPSVISDEYDEAREEALNEAIEFGE